MIKALGETTPHDGRDDPCLHEIAHAIEFLGLLSEDGRSGASLLVADDLQLIAVARSQEEELSAFVPYAAAGTLSLIFANCRVLGNEATDTGLNLRIQAPQAVMCRVKHSLGKASDARVD